MTLQDLGDASQALERVDILGIVAQELESAASFMPTHHTAIFQHFDPPMTRTRRKIGWIDLFRERADMSLDN